MPFLLPTPGRTTLPSTPNLSLPSVLSTPVSPTQPLPYLRHILQNVFLIFLSLALLPFTTAIILPPYLALLILSQGRKAFTSLVRTIYESAYPRPREDVSAQRDLREKKVTVLVTSTEMTKGLILCRAFKKCGHTVIGADTVPERGPGSEVHPRDVLHEAQREGKELRRKVESKVGTEWRTSILGQYIVLAGKLLRDFLPGIPASVLDTDINLPEAYCNPSPGRLSNAIDRYYLLPDPLSKTPQPGIAYDPSQEPHAPGVQQYAARVQQIILREKVDLWVCVSSVTSTIEESRAAEQIQSNIRDQHRCAIMQVPPAVAETLHNKDTFIQHTRDVLHMRVPESHVCRSPDEALNILFPAVNSEDPDPIKTQIRRSTKKYILKSIPLSDVYRADLRLYPLPGTAAVSSRGQTAAELRPMGISPEHPFLLQEFIPGKEFTTHAVIVDGQVTAFTACESADLLMHYRVMRPHNPIFRAMKAFTDRYAADDSLTSGTPLTCQLSFDFIATRREDDPHAGEDRPAAEEGEELDPGRSQIRLYPVECNPRTHTAVVLLSHDPAKLASAYLEAVKHGQEESNEGGEHHTRSSHHSHFPIPPPRPSRQPIGYYFLGHDLVTLLVLPFINLIVGGPTPTHVGEFAEGIGAVAEHLLLWKEAIFEWSDPWVFWWTYHVYWPVEFAKCLWTGKRWSRVNVSTGRIFECR